MDQTEREIAGLVYDLWGMKKGTGFRPYLDFVQFPKYRNFSPDLQVSFNFPLTVIVGRNGTGKSSLLQALSGAPSDSSPGTWWFGTPLDPIDNAEIQQKRRNLPQSHKAAFWYGYTNQQGDSRRALKLRIRRDGDPDYWETSRPVAAYGMVGDRRDPAMSMTAKYMNFKTQISAFDRCFYFSTNNPRLLNSVSKSATWQAMQAALKPTRRRPPRIHDYLRMRAKKLKRALVDGKKVQSGSNEMHDELIELSSTEVDHVSRIIGRKYESGRLLRHRFYETWGMSVLFKTDSLQYSEAFAGSGESAVARLVHEVCQSEPNCMFLLDEPETSLHPGAQLELIRFLLFQAKEKHLQFILSSHSPTLVRCLPQEAIKVFDLNPSGVVTAAENVPTDEAFYVLGHPQENKIHLLVEDSLAKSLVDAVLWTQPPKFASRFIVDFRPGGDAAMKKSAPVLMLKSKGLHFLFDGDNAKKLGKFDFGEISIKTTSAAMDQLIEKNMGVRIVFQEESNMSESDKRQQRLQFMEFANNSFHYLPFKTPEDAIWDLKAAVAFFELSNGKKAIPDFERIVKAKDKFLALGKAVTPTSTHHGATAFQYLHQVFIKRFCESEGPVFDELVVQLQEIANASVR